MRLTRKIDAHFWRYFKIKGLDTDFSNTVYMHLLSGILHACLKPFLICLPPLSAGSMHAGIVLLINGNTTSSRYVISRCYIYTRINAYTVIHLRKKKKKKKEIMYNQPSRNIIDPVC